MKIFNVLISTNIFENKHSCENNLMMFKTKYLKHIFFRKGVVQKFYKVYKVRPRKQQTGVCVDIWVPGVDISTHIYTYLHTCTMSGEVSAAPPPQLVADYPAEHYYHAHPAHPAHGRYNPYYPYQVRILRLNIKYY